MDPPLSPLGKAQAELVAKRLAKEPWSYLYSSDLRRASQTAEAISRLTGLKVHTDPLLREVCQGKREGLLGEEARLKYPDPFAPEVGRETDEELKARGVKIFWRLVNENVGKRFLVVSHGGLIRAFLSTIFDQKAQRVTENTACTLIHWNGKIWECEFFSDSSHLKELEERVI